MPLLCAIIVYGLLSIPLMLIVLCLVKKKPPITEDITIDNFPAVSLVLRACGLLNMDDFEAWVKDYQNDASSVKTGRCGFSDASSRMLVVLLTGGLISYDSLGQDYAGDDLLRDLDAIEEGENYRVLRSRKDLFTTLFRDLPLTDTEFKDAFPNNWNRYGITLNSDKCWIISIVFESCVRDTAFVGHTGVLIDCRTTVNLGSSYLFLEKLDHGGPYRLIKISSLKELIREFFKLHKYPQKAANQRPLMFSNGEYMGTLKQKI